MSEEQHEGLPLDVVTEKEKQLDLLLKDKTVIKYLKLLRDFKETQDRKSQNIIKKEIQKFRRKKVVKEYEEVSGRVTREIVIGKQVKRMRKFSEEEEEDVKMKLDSLKETEPPVKEYVELKNRVQSLQTRNVERTIDTLENDVKVQEFLQARGTEDELKYMKYDNVARYVSLLEARDDLNEYRSKMMDLEDDKQVEKYLKYKFMLERTRERVRSSITPLKKNEGWVFIPKFKAEYRVEDVRVKLPGMENAVYKKEIKVRYPTFKTTTVKVPTKISGVEGTHTSLIKKYVVDKMDVSKLTEDEIYELKKYGFDIPITLAQETAKGKYKSKIRVSPKRYLYPDILKIKKTEHTPALDMAVQYEEGVPSLIIDSTRIIGEMLAPTRRRFRKAGPPLEPNREVILKSGDVVTIGSIIKAKPKARFDEGIILQLLKNGFEYVTTGGSVKTCLYKNLIEDTLVDIPKSYRTGKNGVRVAGKTFYFKSQKPSEKYKNIIPGVYISFSYSSEDVIEGVVVGIKLDPVILKISHEGSVYEVPLLSVIGLGEKISKKSLALGRNFEDPSLDDSLREYMRNYMFNIFINSKLDVKVEHEKQKLLESLEEIPRIIPWNIYYRENFEMWYRSFIHNELVKQIPHAKIEANVELELERRSRPDFIIDDFINRYYLDLNQDSVEAIYWKISNAQPEIKDPIGLKLEASLSLIPERELKTMSMDDFAELLANIIDKDTHQRRLDEAGFIRRSLIDSFVDQKFREMLEELETSSSRDEIRSLFDANYLEDLQKNYQEFENVTEPRRKIEGEIEELDIVHRDLVTQLISEVNIFEGEVYSRTSTEPVKIMKTTKDGKEIVYHKRLMDYMNACSLPILFMRESGVGSHSKFFKAKISNGSYSISKLGKLSINFPTSVALLLPELAMKTDLGPESQAQFILEITGTNTETDTDEVLDALFDICIERIKVERDNLSRSILNSYVSTKNLFLSLRMEPSFLPPFSWNKILLSVSKECQSDNLGNLAICRNSDTGEFYCYDVNMVFEVINEVVLQKEMEGSKLDLSKIRDPLEGKRYLPERFVKKLLKIYPDRLLFHEPEELLEREDIVILGKGQIQSFIPTKEEKFRIANRLEEFMKLWPADITIQTMVDIGAGTGTISKSLAKKLKVDELVMFDIEGGEEINIVEDEKIILGDQRADLVTLLVTLHHFEHLSTMINEVERITKPNGYLFLREHNPKNKEDVDFLTWIHMEDMIKRNVNELQEYYAKYYTSTEIDTYLKSLGYKRVAFDQKKKFNPQFLYHALYQKLNQPSDRILYPEGMERTMEEMVKRYNKDRRFRDSVTKRIRNKLKFKGNIPKNFKSPLEMLSFFS